MIDQLENYNDQKVTITLTNHLIEKLAFRINQQIDHQNEVKAEKLRVERELKHAIAGMSHDLRTPLTAIIGYIELIEKDNLSEHQKKYYLSIARKRAIHLQQLINNFFALSTTDTDDYPMDLEKTHLNSFTKEILMSLYDQFQMAEKKAHVEITEQKLVIITDKNAFKRVIENLLLNALQHSSGDIHMCLGKKKGRAVFAVRNKIDQMIDVEPEKLFERFYTVDQTRQYSRGLGLSIVKSLIEKMNGEMFVVIEENEFNITCMWPLAK